MDKELVLKMAALAHLDVEYGEAETLAAQMGALAADMAVLAAPECADEVGAGENRLRADEVGPSLPLERLPRGGDFSAPESGR